MARLPTVAIVGRPNVGKSTLINRIYGNRYAIVEDEPGVTRDRLYLPCAWLDRHFMLIDTGGIILEDNDEITTAVRRQAEVAIDESDVVIFVVEPNLSEDDKIIAKKLLKAKKPVILVINKVDKPQEAVYVVSEAYSLGMGEPYTISAFHGMGIGDLLDAVIAKLPKVEEEEDAGLTKIAIVGRPNVGKSSMVNALLGKERVIVSPVSGTTRDSIDSICKNGDKEYILIDTAGIRKKSKVDYGLEAFAVVRALKSIAECDVAILVLDANDKVTEQDKKIAGMIKDAGKSCVILVNKWDTIEKSHNITVEFDKEIRRELHFIDYAPILYVSALTKQRVTKVFELIEIVSDEAMKKIPTSLLNQVIQEAAYFHTAAPKGGKTVRMYYAYQAGHKPPAIEIKVNDKSLMPDDYLRYVTNKLREAFGFIGNPLIIYLKNKRETE